MEPLIQDYIGYGQELFSGVAIAENAMNGKNTVDAGFLFVTSEKTVLKIFRSGHFQMDITNIYPLTALM